MALEDAKHIIMHCPNTNISVLRNQMYARISDLEKSTGMQILSNADEIYALILGKVPATLKREICIDLLKICAQHVHCMYRTVLKNRVGIG